MKTRTPCLATVPVMDLLAELKRRMPNVMLAAMVVRADAIRLKILRAKK